MISVDVRALTSLPSQTGPEISPTPLAIGDVIRARVVEGGAQGQPVLMLGGATIAAELPFPVTPGQSLEFTVLEIAPEIKLGLTRPVPDTADGPPAGTTANLSTAGRLLGDLGDALPAATTLPTVTVPGADRPDLLRDPTRLALSLRQAVDQSGLFYESHQAQWIGGLRGEASLRSEPQAAWPPGDSMPTTDATALASRLAKGEPSGELVQMVRQQLDVLQQQTVAFRTDLAPGFAVDWRTRVDPDGQRGGDNGAEARSWETLLSSELGSLQRVDARVGLSGDRVRLTLQANDAALARMRGRVPELVLALEAAGLKLANVDFRAAPATPADAAADDSAP